MSIELEDGTIVRSLPEQVSKNLEDIIDLANRLAALKQQVEIGLSAALHYKGSVATYSDLPSTGNEIGDLWNVLDTGNNYAWTGSAWDEIGSSVDLSNYAVKSGLSNTFSNDNDFTGNVDFDGSSKTVLIGEQTTIMSNTGYLFAEQDSETAYIAHNGAYEEFSFYDLNSGNSIYFDFNNERIYTSASSMDLGDSTHKFNDIFFGGALRDGNNASYGYTLPDSTGLTANSELVDTDSAQTITGQKTIGDSNHTYLPLTFFITTGYTWKIGVILGNSFDIARYNGNALQYGYNFANAGFAPKSNNDKDLGSSSYAWKDLYLSGTAKLPSLSFTDGTTMISFPNNSTIYANKSIYIGGLYPYGTTSNIGTSSSRFVNLYLSGYISDGTNSATATEIAALVAYAKAQGWIS